MRFQTVRYNDAAMNRFARPFPLTPLLVFSIAFGVEEAIIVVYLRHLPDSYTTQAYALEMFREISTLFVIGGVAALVARSWALRARAFCFAFGGWDIVYYIALWKLSGFPALTDTDILFLMPVPWTAPVWAPVSFALLLILVGLFGIVGRAALCSRQLSSWRCARSSTAPRYTRTRTRCGSSLSRSSWGSRRYRSIAPTTRCAGAHSCRFGVASR